MLAIVIPKTYLEALSHPSLKVAMEEEMNALCDCVAHEI